MTVEGDIQYFKEKLLAAIQVPRELSGPPRMSVEDSLIKHGSTYVLSVTWLKGPPGKGLDRWLHCVS